MRGPDFFNHSLYPLQIRGHCVLLSRWIAIQALLASIMEAGAWKTLYLECFLFLVAFASSLAGFAAGRPGTENIRTRYHIEK